MKARDRINRQIRWTLFPMSIAAKVLLILILLWFVIQAPATSPLIYAIGVVALALILSSYFGIKHPVTCPFCAKPLQCSSGFPRLPQDYRFCPTCGAELDKELEDGKKA